MPLQHCATALIMRKRQLEGTCKMVFEGSARMRCVKSPGRSTGGRSTVRLGCNIDVSVDHSRVLAANRRANGAHNDVAHPGRPGLTGLTTPIANPSSHSPEATTSGSRAGDPFNRREQRARSLIHSRARVLMRNVAHETRNGGEAFAWAFAAPVVTVTERRESRHRWWRVSGQTQLEQPRATGQRQCVHAQRGQCSQDELSGRAPKPAQEPALADPHNGDGETGDLFRRICNLK